jgi:hypothetical protein
MNIKIKPGDKISNWTCVETNATPNSPKGIFECVCGTTKIIKRQSVYDGISKSCGCLRSTNLYNTLNKTPFIRRKFESEYNIWLGIRQRCFNKSCKAYGYYGARGIKVCERWNSFENFLNDMGAKPSDNYSVERVDNNSDYSPDNCIWATRSQQSNNRRSNRQITYNEQIYTCKQFADFLNVPVARMWAYLYKLGHTPEEAVARYS